MEKENKETFCWAREVNLKDIMDDAAKRIKRISCPFCKSDIQIPLIARDVDMQIIKHHVKDVNLFMDEVVEFIEETYGVDVRYTLLLKKIKELQSKHLKPKPKYTM